ncbi:hypothetical protein J6590_042763 [Homalodisca vitripennis]|nr:hypothetical protein J6590_042763 [Homalodisca vitripennis]
MEGWWCWRIGELICQSHTQEVLTQTGYLFREGGWCWRIGEGLRDFSEEKDGHTVHDHLYTYGKIRSSCGDDGRRRGNKQTAKKLRPSSKDKGIRIYVQFRACITGSARMKNEYPISLSTKLTEPARSILQYFVDLPVS